MIAKKVQTLWKTNYNDLKEHTTKIINCEKLKVLPLTFEGNDKKAPLIYMSKKIVVAIKIVIKF